MGISGVKFDYETSVVSQKQFNAHIKLYDGYVENFNKIERDKNSLTAEELGGANTTYSAARNVGTSETFALDAVILHELYFENLGDSECKRSEKVDEILSKNFGGVSEFSAKFKAAGLAARGWVVLAYSFRAESCNIFAQDAHDAGVVHESRPLLVLDMYEHAYFLDYATDKGAYIDNFLLGVNWAKVAERAAKLQSLLG
ncbi:superoxide dismutase [Clostridia bacterium]|nr:superoxide dismutase [Clostridia bacterium]